MIHGEGDTYIKPEMAKALFERARGPKELWIVPKAKHNQALSVAGDEYHRARRRVLRRQPRSGPVLPSSWYARPTRPLELAPRRSLGGLCIVLHVPQALPARPLRAAHLVPGPPQAAAVRGRVREPRSRPDSTSPRHPPQADRHRVRPRPRLRRRSRSSPTTASNVPIAPYEYVAPYIERVQKGETNALLADRARADVRADERHHRQPQAHPRHRRLPRRLPPRLEHVGHEDVPRPPRRGSIAMRPIVQMVGDPEEFRTEAGIPCGNLSGYTAMVQKRLIRRMYAVPYVTGKDQGRAGPLLRRPAVLARPQRVAVHGREPEHAGAVRPHARRREGTRCSATSATARSAPTSTSRRTSARGSRARARSDPRRARGTRQRSPRRPGRLYPTDVWPSEATVINTWTGGSMGPYLRQLPQYYGEPPLRDLGLLASEGRMTIPLADGTSSGVLDIWSHYFEFVPGRRDRLARSRRCSAPTNSQEGKSYYIIPTTALRPVPLPHLGPRARDRLLRPHAAGRVPRQGPPLRQPDRREAERVPRHAGDGRGRDARAASRSRRTASPRSGTTSSRTTASSSRSRTRATRRHCSASSRSSTGNSARRTSSTRRSARAAGSARCARC